MVAAASTDDADTTAKTQFAQIVSAKPDVDSCESAKNPPRQEGDEDVTGKTADTIATGIDSPQTTPGTMVAAASTEDADTTATGIDSQETTPGTVVAATSTDGADTTAKTQAAWAGDGSWAIGSWKDLAKMAVGKCLSVDWHPIAGPTPGRVGAAGAERHSAS